MVRRPPICTYTDPPFTDTPLFRSTGASHNDFSNGGWAAVAPGLKRVDDATDIRRRMLVAFEHAELCDDPFERARLMTFVIVGGGPTGVELAGAIAELAKVALARDFRRIAPRQIGRAHV